MDESAIDAQFHRAVDIVQSLPKGGPVQTSYEEKLGLYSLYKQATEGDIAISRPGMLDMLGRAKWDSWNKQKGRRKSEAKRDYVFALLDILRKHSDRPNGASLIHELETLNPSLISRTPRGMRPTSPSSSTSSYHSSAAPSPPTSPDPPLLPNYAPPDPNLPPPDVAPDIIPPSALNSSHKSLLSLSQAAQASGGSKSGHGPGGSESAYSGGQSGIAPFTQMPPPGSRAHSLAGGRAASLEVPYGRKDSVHSLRHRPSHTASPAGLGFIPPAERRSGPGTGTGGGSHASQSFSRPISPSAVHHRDFTPELIGSTPYLGIHQPTPTYPIHPRLGVMGTPSTFSVPPINIPATLQQIQTSLAALHERMNTLERTQAMILRRDERRRGWFWGSTEEEELDEAEDEADREAIAQGRTTVRTGTIRRRKGRWSVRAVWWLLGVIRRLMVDLSMGVFVGIVAVLVVKGWRGQIGRRIRDRLRRLLEPAPT